MKLRTSLVFFSLLALLIVMPFSIAAQDNTPTPEPVPTEEPEQEEEEFPALETNLEELTGDTDIFLGGVVTLEGVLTKFVSANIFIVGEDVLIDDDQVMVINSSGEYLPFDVYNGDIISVTGIVRRGYENNLDIDIEEFDLEIDWVGFDEPINNPIATYYAGNIPDEYWDITVIELTSLDDLVVVESLLED